MENWEKVLQNIELLSGTLETEEPHSKMLQKLEDQVLALI